METLRQGSQGPGVQELQRLLNERGLTVDTDGIFGGQTYAAVRAFQSQNLDQHGQPLTVDGTVGPLTWWSLTHPKPNIETPSAVDFRTMPPDSAGGSASGRAALSAAIGELKAGAGEEGGNNMGPWVQKYLHGLAPIGSSWCAAFTSWCFSQNPGGSPFQYTVGARMLLDEFREKGWEHDPESRYEPVPGDVVIWWRVQADGWQGHAGIVHQLKDGMLYTIEGNKSPKVQGFSYVFSRMQQLLGFGHTP